MSRRSRMPKYDWYAVRWAVLERDQFTCRYCGQFAPNVMLEVDHVLAVCEGGTDDLDNLVTACTACNRGKERYRASGLRRPERVRPSHEPREPVVYPQPSVDALRDVLASHPEGLSVSDLARLTGRHRTTLVATIKRAISSGVPITIDLIPTGGSPRHLYRLDDTAAV